jgi:light-regulated signal transduction histidine kinase (bacteriophytochrome)
MASLIDGLLDYSRLTQVEAEVASVHLDEDLESAVALLKSSIDEAGAVITHDSLPDVQLGRGHMVRVFQNLLSNAIKFRRSGERPAIHVSAERLQTEWVIRVQDNGIGVASEESEAMFAPFNRLHTGKEYPGSGIGLATCKALIERFGGRIGVDSVFGRGATFRFSYTSESSGQ